MTPEKGHFTKQSFFSILKKIYEEMMARGLVHNLEAQGTIKDYHRTTINGNCIKSRRESSEALPLETDRTHSQ